MKGLFQNVFKTFLLTLLFTCQAFGQEIMVGTNSVTDQTVGATTTLNFQLFLQVSSVSQGDYLMIDLPSGFGISFLQSRAFCGIQTPLSVSGCTFLNVQKAKITFSTNGATSVQSIQGSIRDFKNPQSTLTVTGIVYTLFSSSNVQKAVFQNGSLSNFIPTTVNVSLSSASTTVGATSTSLTIAITPKYILPANGSISVSFPNYYLNSGQQQYISSTTPGCTAQGVSQISCSYSFASQTLVLNYRFSDGKDRTVVSYFTIGSFNNPISPVPRAGFVVSTLDQNGNEIADSGSLTLSGITNPGPFTSFQYQFLTSKGIGAYTSFAIALGLSVPVEQNCFIKFIFPEQFTFDSQLFQLEGSSYFLPAGSTTQKVPWLSLNTTSNQVVVAGCQQTFGANLIGTLQFQQIKNPKYLNGTGTFQVFLAKDKDFTQLIMAQTSGLTIPATGFQPGTILSTTISPQTSVVSEQSTYTFTFTPTNPLGFPGSSNSMIQVTFPQLLQLSSTCSLSQISFQFATTATCSISGQIVTINNPFIGKNFTGNTQLSFTISRAKNPTSVRSLGAFTINTFVQINSVYFQVDGAVISNGVVLTPGLVSAAQPLSSSSVISYDETSIYSFSLTFQHTVTIGSAVLIMLPSGVQILNPTQLQANCRKSDNTLLSCSYVDQNKFQVNINVQSFPSGISKGDILSFKVSSIQNPRLVGPMYQFIAQSVDSLGFTMDSSIPDPLFNIQMKTPGQINSFSVSALNTTNGATTTYSLTISPNTPILSGDILTITFPVEITLPSSTNLQCSGFSNQVSLIQCINLGSNNLQISFTTVRSLPADVSFTIQIQSVKNSVSLRPSSPFSNFRLQDSTGSQISRFGNTTRITNQIVSNISSFALVQSTREPGQQADYTIRFTTQNPLPQTASIMVTTPLNVAIIPVSSACYVVTSVQSINVCQFVESTALRITNAFRSQASSYQGVVSVNFNAYNPPDNASPTTTLVMTIFDDATFTFKIDQIASGLNPTFTCSYPCSTCDYTNSAQCLSCPQGQYDPKYLQKSKTTGLTTCVNACSPGYTFSPSVQPLTCIPCDISCATCQSGGSIANQQTCLSCASNYPVFWQQGAKCYPSSLGCPVGTFTSNVNRCTTCTAPCLNCTSATSCSVCDPASNLPLLMNKACVAKCMSGFTPVYTSGKGVCQSCQSPCATCVDGLPSKCQSCANGTLQFLFGSQCVAQCPVGTNTNMTSKQCTGCQEGCDLCQTADNSICLKCSTGLSLLDGQCLSECPPTHQKSSDGASCELRQYPLNKVFVPFPFLLLLIILHLIILASWRITKYRTLITQNSICATSVVLILAIAFQLLRAFIELQSLIIVMSIVMLAGNAVVNVAYVATFRIQIDDYQFNQYIKYHKLAFTIVVGLCSVFSLHMFRICYGKLFALPVFYAGVTDSQTFYRPLLLYSLIQIISIATPLVLANLYFILVSESNYVFTNQLQMTNIEVLVTAVLLIGLVLFERFFQHPRYISFKPNDLEAVQFAQSYEDKKDKMDLSSRRLLQSSTELLANNDFIPLQERLDRHQELIELVRQIRGNINNELNVNLDMIIELDLKAQDEKVDTDPSPRMVPLMTDGDEDPINQSFPGCNPVWLDDGTDKRLQLLQWMELQVQINAERERLILEETARLERYQEKETMYDNNLFDNVFFSSKSHRDMEVQPDIEPISYVDNYAQMDNEEETQRNLIRKLEKQEVKQQAKLAKKASKQQQRIERLRSAAAQTDLQQRPGTAIKRSEVASSQKSGNQRSISRESSVRSEKEKSIRSRSATSDVKKSESNKSKFGRKSHAGKIDSLKMIEKVGDQIRQPSKKSLIDQDGLSTSKISRQSGQKWVKTKDERDIEQSIKSQVVISDVQDVKSQATDKIDEIQQQKQLRTNQSQSQSSESKIPSIKNSSQPRAQQIEFDYSSFSSQIQEEILGDELASKHSIENESQLSLNITSNRETIIKKSLRQQQSTGALNAMPETLKWMQRVKLMKTLMLDGREPRRRPQTAGIYLHNEDNQHSETEKTLLEKMRSQANEQRNVIEEQVPTDEEDFYNNGMVTDDSYTTVRSDERPREDLEDRYRDNIYLNHRNFNIFEVLGNFSLDDNGKIVDRRKTLLEADFHDLDGQLVNEYGYLINEDTRFIRSRYTYEDLFLPIHNSIEERGELPMPYRLERHNFNPHKVLGNFDFDAKTRRPIFLKNKFNQLTDKNFRIVNQFGFLINEKEDIVDNDGKTILMKSMLEAYKGDFPTLYNYTGRAYKIQDVIGQLKKDDNSKEILVRIDKKSNRAVDDIGRPVNANGYLIDDKGNIVNAKNEIIWNFWELAYLEPPKIFAFTEFSLSWIKGNLDRDVANFDPRDDELYDLDNRLINTAGYLIDKDENVIDYYGRIVFRKEVLTEKLGQDSEIPKVFLMNILSAPQIEGNNVKASIKDIESLGHDTTGLGRSGLDFERSGMQSSKRVTLRNANTSMFSMAEPESRQVSGVRNIKIPMDSPNKSQLPVIQDYESQDNDHRPKKVKKQKSRTGKQTHINGQSRVNRQNSRMSENLVVAKRHGDKVLNLYQQYINDGQLSNDRVRNGSPLMAETVTGQRLVPIRLSMQTPLNQGSHSVMRVRNEGLLNSHVPKVPLLQNLEKMNSRYASNYRSRQDQSGVFTPPPFAQTGLSAIGLLSKGTQGMQQQDAIRMNFNPLSESLQSGIRGDDNKSYASRAETVFRHTRKVLRREESALPEINARDEARNAIHQQMKSMSNIYGKKLQQKRATSTDF